MSRKSKQCDIQPIDQSKVESDLNILFELLEKIREFLEDPDLFPHDIQTTRKPYGFMQSSFWVIMMVHVMVCGDL